MAWGDEVLPSVEYTGPKKYIFFGGMDSRFSGRWWVAEVGSQEDFDANMGEANAAAEDTYSSYEPGMTWQDCEDQAEETGADAQDIYNEDMQSWLSVYAAEYSEKNVEHMQSHWGIEGI